ncbi:MAG: cytochrome c [Verrucomicrobiae bacterium]|nr:cytochrome c [Verrucomicrobiae bacterium]MCP5519417.1 cytochrome c [Verrucomicrobiales bacterium]MCP5526991.1 cytochrome c [Verrucomicrobiales bacterium]
MKYIAIIAALAFVGGTATMRAADEAALAKAKVVYEKECAKCHGKEGKGDTKMGQKLGCKDYSKAEVQSKMKDEEAFKAIKEGLKKDGKTLMKPTKGVNDQQIKDLVAYMRKLKKD